MLPKVRRKVYNYSVSIALLCCQWSASNGSFVWFASDCHVHILVTGCSFRSPHEHLACETTPSPPSFPSFLTCLTGLKPRPQFLLHLRPHLLTLVMQCLLRREEWREGDIFEQRNDTSARHISFNNHKLVHAAPPWVSFCSVSLLGSKLLTEVISAILNRYMTLTTPIN